MLTLARLAQKESKTTIASVTLAEVAEHGFCTGCGTCAGICPPDAINMKIDANGIYFPAIDNLKCTECGLCLFVCTGYSFDLNELNEFVFGKKADGALGNFVNSYLGYSTDEKIRWRSSSGGIITSLLVLALESKLVDGALVTVMSKENPLQSEAIVALTKQDIISALGSKYCPAHTNTKLRDIMTEKKRYAVVGLPCQISGIRKAEMIYQRLKDRIALHVSVFCSGNCSYLATELLLKRTGVRKDDVASVGYRGNGWPGEISIRLRNGTERVISNPYYRNWDCISQFYVPMYCRLCPDVTGELSDVSVGDAWLPELERDRNGTSIIVSRTQEGEDFLNIARSKGKITIVRTSPEKVQQSQMFGLSFKKRALGSFISLGQAFGILAPPIWPKPTSTGFGSLLAGAAMHLTFYFGSKEKLRLLLRYVPFPVLRTHYRILSALSLLC